MSDTYAALIGTARAAGLSTFVNVGRAALARPDPSDATCRARRWDTCRVLDDVVTTADYLLTENTPIFPDLSAPLDPNLEGQLRSFGDAVTARRGRAAPVALGKVWAPKAQTTRVASYLATVGRVAGHPVAVGSGDDRCGGADAVPALLSCSRGGVAPARVVSTRLGAALDPTWSEHGCDPDGTGCVLVRRYDRGIAVLNPTSRTRDTGRIALGVDGCRRLERRTTGTLIGAGTCLTALRRMPGPFTGEMYVYRDAPTDQLR
jgi:hypothetical protein